MVFGTSTEMILFVILKSIFLVASIDYYDKTLKSLLMPSTCHLIILKSTHPLRLALEIIIIVGFLKKFLRLVNGFLQVFWLSK
jgi:hypothetical protein